MTIKPLAYAVGSVLAVAGLFLSGCSAASTTTTDHGGTMSPSPGATSASPTSTAEGLRLASWGSNVTVTIADGTIRYVSNGIPNHPRQAQYALPNQGVRVPTATTATAGKDPTVAQNYDLKITTNPVMAASKTSTSLGTIGLMISGAALFNPYEGNGTTVAMKSNFTVTGSDGKPVAFLDSCNGHPTPMGAYHYHGLPSCITSTIDTQGGPSHILGVALDGFPIYGDRDASGAVITASQLDKCNGITSVTPEFPNGIYHYVLLDTADSTSSIKCFSGTVDASNKSAMAGMPGMGAP